MAELIHVGEISSGKPVFLRKIADKHYTWFVEEANGQEKEELSAPNIEEAIREAKKRWKNNDFRLIPCGFRFTLPERDEHGSNALFYQAAKSMESMTGIYFDEELGHNCIVNQIPLNVRELYRKWKQSKKLS